MSSEHHLAGPCEGISTIRDGATTTINFRSEGEARAFDYALCGALYKEFPVPSSEAKGHTTIPEDVMKKAYILFRNLKVWNHTKPDEISDRDDTHTIARAIMAATEAERERCAHIRTLVERAQAIISTLTYPNWHADARSALSTPTQEKPHD